MKERKIIIFKKLVNASARYYANVTCPLFTYQPEVGKSVKTLRKIKDKSK